MNCISTIGKGTMSAEFKWIKTKAKQSNDESRLFKPNIFVKIGKKSFLLLFSIIIFVGCMRYMYIIPWRHPYEWKQNEEYYYYLVCVFFLSFYSMEVKQYDKHWNEHHFNWPIWLKMVMSDEREREQIVHTYQRE